MTQLSASFKKEMMLFTRSYKLLTITLVLIGFSIIEPAIIKTLDTMTTIINDNAPTAQADSASEMNIENFFDATIGDTSDAATGVGSFAGDVCSTGLLVVLLLLIGVAGKEQKRRATIIPACSGLRATNYLLPKFLIYPSAVFLLTIASTFICFFISSAVFETNTLTVKGIFLSGVFSGLFLAFCVCAHLFVGLSTSRPGLSAGVLISLAFLVPAILSHPSLNLADKYSPVALKFFAAYALLSDIDNGVFLAYNSSNVQTSVIITIALMFLMYLLTLFIHKAKKIDNSGNDALL